MNIIDNRINEIRRRMAEDNADYYIVGTYDPHMSEYLSDYYKLREYLTGFTGSNGTLLVTKEEALMWTDGRYFVQADKELSGTCIKVMRGLQRGVPSLSEYVGKHVKAGETIAFNGRCMPYILGNRLESIATEKAANINMQAVYGDELWEKDTASRPMDSCSHPYILEPEVTGEDTACKLERVREYLASKNADYLYSSKLDDIMWLLNIRGNDIECNPVLYSYCLVGRDSCLVAIKKAAVNEEIKDYFEALNITLIYYEDYECLFGEIREGDIVIADKNGANYYDIKRLEAFELTDAPSVIERYKSVKNDTEIARIKECYKEDSVVLTRFLMRLKNRVKTETINEYEAAMLLDSMRAELKDFIELSFPTISAYGENAAMMHYEATKEKCAVLEAKGLYLVDSGAQYMTGTTDVTRTIALGPVTTDMKKHFTLALAGMLRLQNAVFLKGCTGRNLDILAREPLWNIDVDYKCGTGHGIGYILNVHEGPQGIRWGARAGEEEAALKPGMIVSDEPGVYVEGQYGIRCENIILCQSKCINNDGEFLEFVPLTLVPFDKDVIDKAYLNSDDIKMLNEYHKVVYESLKGSFEGEELSWLKTATASI